MCHLLPAGSSKAGLLTKMTTHFSYPAPALQDELRKVAQAMVAPAKGILATDDTLEGMGDRLKSVGLDNTEDGRRRYRQMLFTADPKVTLPAGAWIAGDAIAGYFVYSKNGPGYPF